MLKSDDAEDVYTLIETVFHARFAAHVYDAMAVVNERLPMTATTPSTPAASAKMHAQRLDALETELISRLNDAVVISGDQSPGEIRELLSHDNIALTIATHAGQSRDIHAITGVIKRVLSRHEAACALVDADAITEKEKVRILHRALAAIGKTTILRALIDPTTDAHKRVKELSVDSTQFKAMCAVAAVLERSEKEVEIVLRNAGATSTPTSARGHIGASAATSPPDSYDINDEGENAANAMIASAMTTHPAFALDGRPLVTADHLAKVAKGSSQRCPDCYGGGHRPCGIRAPAALCPACMADHAGESGKGWKVCHFLERNPTWRLGMGKGKFFPQRPPGGGATPRGARGNVAIAIDGEHGLSTGDGWSGFDISIDGPIARDGGGDTAHASIAIANGDVDTANLSTDANVFIGIGGNTTAAYSFLGGALDVAHYGDLDQGATHHINVADGGVVLEKTRHPPGRGEPKQICAGGSMCAVDSIVDVLYVMRIKAINRRELDIDGPPKYLTYYASVLCSKDWARTAPAVISLRVIEQAGGGVSTLDTARHIRIKTPISLAHPEPLDVDVHIAEGSRGLWHVRIYPGACSRRSAELATPTAVAASTVPSAQPTMESVQLYIDTALTTAMTAMRGDFSAMLLALPAELDVVAAAREARIDLLDRSEASRNADQSARNDVAAAATSETRLSTVTATIATAPPPPPSALASTAAPPAAHASSATPAEALELRGQPPPPPPAKASPAAPAAGRTPPPPPSALASTAAPAAAHASSAAPAEAQEQRGQPPPPPPAQASPPPPPSAPTSTAAPPAAHASSAAPAAIPTQQTPPASTGTGAHHALVFHTFSDRNGTLDESLQLGLLGTSVKMFRQAYEFDFGTVPKTDNASVLLLDRSTGELHCDFVGEGDVSDFDKPYAPAAWVSHRRGGKTTPFKVQLRVRRTLRLQPLPRAKWRSVLSADAQKRLLLGFATVADTERLMRASAALHDATAAKEAALAKPQSTTMKAIGASMEGSGQGLRDAPSTRGRATHGGPTHGGATRNGTQRDGPSRGGGAKRGGATHGDEAHDGTQRDGTSHNGAPRGNKTRGNGSSSGTSSSNRPHGGKNDIIELGPATEVTQSPYAHRPVSALIGVLATVFGRGLPVTRAHINHSLGLPGNAIFNGTLSRLGLGHLPGDNAPHYGSQMNVRRTPSRRNATGQSHFEVGERWDLDVVGPTDVPFNGYSYVLSAYDKVSRYGIEVLMRDKSDVPDACNVLITTVASFGLTVLEIKGDGEFDPATHPGIAEVATKRNVRFVSTPRESPARNGHAERNHAVVEQRALAMAQATGNHDMGRMWGYYRRQALCVKNASLCTATKRIPYEHLRGMKADYSALLPMLCWCAVHDESAQRGHTSGPGVIARYVGVHTEKGHGVARVLVNGIERATKDFTYLAPATVAECDLAAHCSPIHPERATNTSAWGHVCEATLTLQRWARRGDHVSTGQTAATHPQRATAASSTRAATRSASKANATAGDVYGDGRLRMNDTNVGLRIFAPFTPPGGHRRYYPADVTDVHELNNVHSAGRIVFTFTDSGEAATDAGPDGVEAALNARPDGIFDAYLAAPTLECFAGVSLSTTEPGDAIWSQALGYRGAPDFTTSTHDATSAEIDTLHDAPLIAPVPSAGIGQPPIGKVPSPPKAFRGPDGTRWIAAYGREWLKLERWGVFGPPIHVSDVPPDAPPCLQLAASNKEKIGDDGLVNVEKCRIYLLGDREIFGVHYFVTASAVAAYSTIMMQFAETALHIADQGTDEDGTDLNHRIYRIDVEGAYCHAEKDVPVWVSAPHGHAEWLAATGCEVPRDAHKFVRPLLKSLYGGHSAGVCWFETIDPFLRSIGFVPSSIDTCAYLRKRGRVNVTIALVVDNVIMCGPTGGDHGIDSVVKALQNRFPMDEPGELTFELGVNVHTDLTELCVRVGMSTYIRAMLARRMPRADANTKSVPTPLPPHYTIQMCDMPSNDAEREGVDKKAFLEELGELGWVATFRPDMAAGVATMSTVAYNPGPQHFKVLKRMQRYLLGTIDLSVVFHYSGNPEMVFYTDASFASELGHGMDRTRSRTGAVGFLAGAAFWWASKKHATTDVAPWSAELVALFYVVKAALGFRRLQKSLDYACTGPTPIYEDCEVVSKTIKRGFYNMKTRHLRVALSFITDAIHFGEIVIRDVRTREQLADFFTKQEKADIWCAHRDQIMGTTTTKELT
jgi:hypothetical protein